MAERYLALKTVMMPRDTNPHGTIFGGVLLSQIDQAGATGARWEISRRGVEPPVLVTVAMNRVEFHQPVFVGDVVSYWTHVIRVGRTSITMHVDVEVERDGEMVRVTEADVVYVAIAETPQGRRPIPIFPEGEKSGEQKS
jgi:acyl-CoA thioesterase YciA